PHTWKKTTSPPADLTRRLESFWLYYDFVVRRNNRRVAIGDGYLAVYVSQQSGPPAVTKPNGKDREFEVREEDNNAVRVRHADLIQSRLVEYSNEFNHLHLFKFDNGADKKEWIDAAGWNPAFVNPNANRNRKPFWPHTMDFAGYTNRYVYWLMAKENAD